MKKTFLILIVLSVLAGCALDDIKQKPTCTTSNDFSQLDGSQYSEDALVDVDQVCPSEAETNPNCYQNLKSPSTYLCTICPRNQYYCYNSCVDTPCETDHCHYADDMIAKEAPEYTGLPVANTTCATENDYRYCYAHNEKKQIISAHIAQKTLIRRATALRPKPASTHSAKTAVRSTSRSQSMAKQPHSAPSPSIPQKPLSKHPKNRDLTPSMRSLKTST